MVTRCQYLRDWRCLRAKRPTLDDCRFCLDARQRWITLLDPVMRDAQRVNQENSDLREKIRRMEASTA